MIDNRIRLVNGVVNAYANGLVQDWWVHGIFVLLALAIWRLFRIAKNRNWHFRLPNYAVRWFPFALGALALATGLALVISRASLVDDAFVSFRYARNFAEGHGLVFNIGERVEGYTNFLWTLLIGLSIKLTSGDATGIALVLGVICFAANMCTIFLIGIKLAQRHGLRLYAPLAVVALAVSQTFTEYGTTGLETPMASLFVNLGLLALLDSQTRRRCLAAGSMFILATFTRPDHSIFYVAGAAVVATTELRAILAAEPGTRKGRWASGLKCCVMYASPFLLYAAYLFWKRSYYGNFLPNTCYAKSVELFYFSQGFVYATLFYLGSHFLLLCILFATYLWWPNKHPVVGRFKLFAVVSFVGFNFYILKVGGDFMHGRFYVSLLPIVFLAVEDLFYLSLRRGIFTRSGGAVFVACIAVLFISTKPVDMFSDRARKWGIADESRVYRLSNLFPAEVAHFTFPLSMNMKKYLYDRDIKPVIATHGIGMVGYYTRLPLIDQLGLTDATVAHQKLTVRSSPGHEKKATNAYLRSRNVLFSRGLRRIPVPFKRMASVRFGDAPDKQWTILCYQRDWVELIRAKSPEIEFSDFEKYLDKYISRLRKIPVKQIKRNMIFFREYYFSCNNDPARLNKLERFIAAREQAVKDK